MACHLGKRTTTKKGKFKDLVRKKKLLKNKRRRTPRNFLDKPKHKNQQKQ